MAACFGGQEPVAVLDGDIEANPENYDVAGQLKALKDCAPMRVACYAGMKIFTTRNVDKERGIGWPFAPGRTFGSATRSTTPSSRATPTRC